MLFIQLFHKNRLSVVYNQRCMEVVFYVAEFKMSGLKSVTVSGRILSSWPALKAIYCRAASGSAPATPFKTAPLRTDSG